MARKERLTESVCTRAALEITYGLSVAEAAATVGCTERGLRKAMSRHGVLKRLDPNSVDKSLTSLVRRLVGEAVTLESIAPDAADSLYQAADHVTQANNALLDQFARLLAGDKHA